MQVARIFSDVNYRYHISPEENDILDARWTSYETKAGALRAAAAVGYTHAIGSGTYWDGVRTIPRRFRSNA